MHSKYNTVVWRVTEITGQHQNGVSVFTSLQVFTGIVILGKRWVRKGKSIRNLKLIWHEHQPILNTKHIIH